MIKKFLSEKNSVKFWNMVIILPMCFITIMCIKDFIHLMMYVINGVSLYDYANVYNQRIDWVLYYLFMVITLIIPYVLVKVIEYKKNYWTCLYPLNWIILLCDVVFDFIAICIVKFNKILDGEKSTK